MDYEFDMHVLTPVSFIRIELDLLVGRAFYVYCS